MNIYYKPQQQSVKSRDTFYYYVSLAINVLPIGMECMSLVISILVTIDVLKKPIKIP